MKLKEMINQGDPNMKGVDCLAPYLIRECPQFIERLQRMEPLGVNTASVVSGMDIIIRYIQMYDVPDDIGDIIEEVKF